MLSTSIRNRCNKQRSLCNKAPTYEVRTCIDKTRHAAESLPMHTNRGMRSHDTYTVVITTQYRLNWCIMAATPVGTHLNYAIRQWPHQGAAGAANGAWGWLHLRCTYICTPIYIWTSPIYIWTSLGFGFDSACPPGFRTQLHVTTSLSTGGGPVSYVQLSEGGFQVV